MNLLNVFEQINAVDPEFSDRISPRREAIKSLASMSKKVTLAALPCHSSVKPFLKFRHFVFADQDRRCALWFCLNT
jgi:hypothetical protein